MIDALLYAVRDTIRAAGFNYDQATCQITEDGRPPPRCGSFFVSVHGGAAKSDRDNQLFEEYDFSVTLTARIVRVSVDRVGDQLVARNIARDPIGWREGFNARIEQLRTILHMNWQMTVLPNQATPSANDNLVAWLTGPNAPAQVYGFCEPARYRGFDTPKMVGAEWFQCEPGYEEIGIKSEMRFGGAKRMQPQTASVGPFA